MLVMTNHFTKFAMAVPSHNQGAAIAACVPLVPIVTIKGWFHVAGHERVKQTSVVQPVMHSSYHPLGNLSEQFTHILLSMLGCLEKGN